MVRKKTSLYIDEDLWREFSTFVVSKYGNRKLSDSLEDALRQYMK